MKFNKTALFLLLVFAITSCTRVDLEDVPKPTPPTLSKGKITLITDWSKRTSGIEQPTSYIVEINKQKLTYNQITNTLPELDAGTYPILIYNTPDEMEINGTTATVTTTGNQVNPQPGWLFTNISEAEYVDNTEKSVTAVMQQQVRQLTIELTVTEGDANLISTTTAVLTGVAGSLDFKTNTHSGTNLSVIPVFTRNGSKLTATVRLLGITTEAQTISLDIIFTDGRIQHIESDVSAQLTDFNTDKHIPKTLSANLNLPIAVGFEATITGWKSSNSSSGTAQ